MKNTDMLKEKKEEHRHVSDKKDNILDAMELINMCNSFSELIDRLCIENVRLWHILDDTDLLQKELEKPGISESARTALLEKVAKKTSDTVEVTKRRSKLKKAIDEIFILNVKALMEGIDVNVCNEIKSYGRSDSKSPTE